MWSIDLTKENGNLSFTAAAHVGKFWRFHPIAIKSNIVRNYGNVVYEQWKNLVIEDIDSLRFIVKDARKRTKNTHFSATCCESSTRLCKGELFNYLILILRTSSRL